MRFVGRGIFVGHVYSPLMHLPMINMNLLLKIINAVLDLLLHYHVFHLIKHIEIKNSVLNERKNV